MGPLKDKKVCHGPILSAVIVYGLAIYPCLAVTSYKINLLGSNATQSSDVSPSQFTADKAVDGKTFKQMGQPTCTHTKNDARAWWMVRLDQVYVVEAVKLFNRQGAHMRLQKLNISVGFVPDISQQTLCKYYDKTVPKESSDTVYCTRPLLGTYVSVQRTSSHTYGADGSVTRSDGFLTICEVEVYGYEGKLSLNKKIAQQSSTLQSAEKAVDGKTGASHNRTDVCSSTDEGAQSWWRIKLDKLYTVQAVKIYNTREMYRRLRELNIFVGPTTNLTEESLCSFYNGTVPPLGAALIECNGLMEGTYVTIQKTTRADYNDNGTLTTTYGGYLTLCEVEVFGYEVVTCGSPPNITGTTRSGTDFKYWTSILYSCNPGYEVVSGNTESRCTVERSWTAVNITCGRVNCGQPPTISDAHWTGNNFTYASTVVYSCNKGFRLASENTKKRCGTNKTWIGTDIECEAIIVDKSKCKAPTPPKIQSVYISYDNNGKTTNVTIAWQTLPWNGHHCNNYTKFEVLYTTGRERQKTIELPPFGKALPHTFTFLIPSNSEYSLKLHVYNDAGLLGASKTFTVSKKHIDMGSLSFGVVTGLTVGGVGVLFMISAVVYIAGEKRRFKEKHLPEDTRGSPEKARERGDSQSLDSGKTTSTNGGDAKLEDGETKSVHNGDAKAEDAEGVKNMHKNTKETAGCEENLYANYPPLQDKDSATHACQPADNIEEHGENSGRYTFEPSDQETEMSDYQNVSMKHTGTPMFQAVV